MDGDASMAEPTSAEPESGTPARRRSRPQWFGTVALVLSTVVVSVVATSLVDGLIRSADQDASGRAAIAQCRRSAGGTIAREHAGRFTVEYHDGFINGVNEAGDRAVRVMGSAAGTGDAGPFTYTYSCTLGSYDADAQQWGSWTAAIGREPVSGTASPGVPTSPAADDAPPSTPGP
ncbi:hypothetical protein GCM10009682_02310 [Luedemannella flava]|uniref:Uncharacterized protein n=1 Tax=Luedemannella flava TaxID=349316 RepID=A0ABN2LC93_9ACTN